MQNPLRTYFKFTKKEKVMMVVILVLFCIWRSAQIWGPLFQKQTHQLEDIVMWGNESDSLLQTKNVNYQKKELFKFDPNSISYDSLLILGFTPKLAQRLIQFRKYNPIEKVADLKKLYGLSEQMFEKIQAYIVLKPNEKTRDMAQITTKESYQSPQRIQESREKLILNMNKAAEEEWMLLQGIGATLSKRIVSYRKKLGGFYAIDQLLEVYGIDTNLLLKIEPHLKLDAKIEGNIKINSGDVKELAAHPYLSYKEAQLICNYRLHHGLYPRKESLYGITAIDSQRIQKIWPYINLDE
jgi:competence protein ComEA